jgi:hypothetical protein
LVAHFISLRLTNEQQQASRGVMSIYNEIRTSRQLSHTVLLKMEGTKKSRRSARDILLPKLLITRHRALAFPDAHRQ